MNNAFTSRVHRLLLTLTGLTMAAPAFSQNLPGPEINTTITPVEEQQKERKRPTFPQPTELTGSIPKTTLPLTPQKGESIVFLGNSLAERMEHFGYFETLLHTQFPTSEITFRNMGFPGHTPGFRPESGQPNPWAFPDARKYRPEIRAHHGKGHYPTPDEWLKITNASTIVAFFGFNESFDGSTGVDNFRAELSAFVDHTLTRSYDGSGKAPRLILATPIAMEQHPAYLLPNAQERSALLAQYAAAVQEVAKEKNIGLLDLFTPSRDWFASAEGKLTINGVHLSGEGYAKLAPLLMKEIFAVEAQVEKDGGLLRKAIYDKSWFWRNDYRMLNGVHAYGQRWAPYGNVNYPEEIEKIRQMTVLRDQNLWAIAQGKSNSLKVDDAGTRPLTPIKSNYKPSTKNGNPNYLLEKEALEKFTLPKGYEVSVFATEQEFPNLGNPCQMQFDNKGRLWVSTVPSYPHYKPGGPLPNDKLLIYEDTDGDGRADKETIFAEGLHIPIGFEITPEGVYISEEPYLTLHKDLDGDDRADTKEYLLDGFDPHDTHHAISAFDIDNGGGIFMCEGRFLHSQVETPWGPQRMTDGGAWRFDPKSWKVERVLQRDVHNPWGVAHDEYGQNILNDASGGSQYWMLGYSVKVPHGHEIRHVEKFNHEHHIRPSSGSEFLHSSHFPDEVQGDYLYANSIGFLGIKQFESLEDGGEIKGKHRQDLIQSSDGNCRPADLELAPDGSLYFTDWHNVLIGHMQHNARDPLRNSVYGRIYRITYPSRALVKPPEVSGASIATLFENMKLPELNARRRSHLELRGREASQVITAAQQFAAQNASDERLTLEALWATWGHQQPDLDLLKKSLNAQDHRIRSAAVRIVRHCLHILEQPEKYLLQAAADTHLRVRLEALSAGSWLGGKEGARILLTVAAHGNKNDKWIRNSLNSAILLLKPHVTALLESGEIKKESIPELKLLLCSKLSALPPEPESAVSQPLSARLKTDRTFREKYFKGEELYSRDASCATCHLASGIGVPKIYPPLNGSEWVTGDPERLAKLAIHGIWGKITVKGIEYDPAKGVPPMTAFGAMYNDDEMAAVLTYVRSSWGNVAPEVSAELVKKTRAQSKNQEGFYNPDSLLKEHPMPVNDPKALYLSPESASTNATATYDSSMENVINGSGLEVKVSALTDETIRQTAHRKGYHGKIQFSNAPRGSKGGKKSASFEFVLANATDAPLSITHLAFWNYTQEEMNNRGLGAFEIFIDQGNGYPKKPSLNGFFSTAKEPHTPQLIPLSEFIIEANKKATIKIVAQNQGGNSLGLDEVVFRALPHKK